MELEQYDSLELASRDSEDSDVDCSPCWKRRRIEVEKVEDDEHVTMDEDYLCIEGYHKDFDIVPQFVSLYDGYMERFGCDMYNGVNGLLMKRIFDFSKRNRHVFYVNVQISNIEYDESKCWRDFLDEYRLIKNSRIFSFQRMISDFNIIPKGSFGLLFSHRRLAEKLSDFHDSGDDYWCFSCPFRCDFENEFNCSFINCRVDGNYSDRFHHIQLLNTTIYGLYDDKIERMISFSEACPLREYYLGTPLVTESRYPSICGEYMTACCNKSTIGFSM